MYIFNQVPNKYLFRVPKLSKKQIIQGQNVELSQKNVIDFTKKIGTRNKIRNKPQLPSSIRKKSSCLFFLVKQSRKKGPANYILGKKQTPKKNMDKKQKLENYIMHPHRVQKIV